MLGGHGTISRTQPFLTAALLATLAISGCGGSDSVPSEKPAASKTNPQSLTPSTRFTGKWHGINDKCPQLNGATAQSLQLPSTGAAATYSDNIAGQLSSCTWGKGEGSITINLNVYRLDNSQTAEQKAGQDFEESWKKYINGDFLTHLELESGLGDKANLGVHRSNSNVVMLILSSNVTVKMVYQTPQTDSTTGKQTLDRYRETMRGLAADVLDDLS